MAETKRTFDETKAAYAAQYRNSPFFETWFPRKKFLSAEYDDQGNFSISREDDGIYGVALGTAPHVPSNWKSFSIDSGGISSIPEGFKAVAEWDCYWSPTRSSKTIEVGVASDSEIKEFLDAHAPQSSVFPGNNEIERWVVIREGRDLLGVAAICRWESGFLVISSVATHSDRRGEGWGKKVMAATLEVGHQLGAEHLSLGVMHQNESAQRLYSSMGFQLMHNFTYCERR